MLLILGGTLALYDYMRVVVIFAPPADAGVARQRIADGRNSVFFAPPRRLRRRDHRRAPGHVMAAFERAPHYLLDARLMMAWAKALDERGETDKARYVAARLQEFQQRPGRTSSSRLRPDAAAQAAAAAVPVPGRRVAPSKVRDFR